jgi:hypothetical protein
MKYFGLLTTALVFSTISTVVYSQPKTNIAIYGYLEKAMLVEATIEMEAKLDTGADNSSLNASEINYFEREGKKWVRFRVEGDDGRNATFEREVLRTAVIKGRTGSDATRPVVKLRICIGRKSETVEVNLTDRSNYKYPLLLGRSFLEKGFMVNSADQFTTPLNCTIGGN